MAMPPPALSHFRMPWGMSSLSATPRPRARLSTGRVWPKPWTMKTASGWMNSVTKALILPEWPLEVKVT